MSNTWFGDAKDINTTTNESMLSLKRFTNRRKRGHNLRGGCFARLSASGSKRGLHHASTSDFGSPGVTEDLPAPPSAELKDDLPPCIPAVLPALPPNTDFDALTPPRIPEAFPPSVDLPCFGNDFDALTPPRIPAVLLAFPLGIDLAFFSSDLAAPMLAPRKYWSDLATKR
ncbi:hypothetical protein M413DRAFT_26815 [Hebeloma cylindrosporum]|uniref:Uncharacterized protein n=1 Tax=Hebeloma cylindrosporum TaxID=76867 RepID=A0A0C3C1P2_HEBCY|nr:hypothetical protein M413DRAFT_26815 [Hebeloma cylindrosporum h7]